MPHNSRKCGPISVILLLSYSRMNWGKIDLSPDLKCVDNYLEKSECSTAQLSFTK